MRLLGVWMTRSERERSALLFLLLALAAMVLVVGRAARDALFLMHFPVTWIAPMWMAYAAVSSVISIALSKSLALIASLIRAFRSVPSCRACFFAFARS